MSGAYRKSGRDWRLGNEICSFFFFSLISLALARIHQFRDCLGRWKKTEKLIENDLKLDLDWMSVAGSREKSENYYIWNEIIFSRISISGHCLLALSSEKWCEIKFSFSRKHSLEKMCRAQKAPHEANEWHAHVSLLWTWTCEKNSHFTETSWGGEREKSWVECHFSFRC